MMKQIQKMQEDMEAKQAEVQETEFNASAGGGAVEVVLNGAHEAPHILSLSVPGVPTQNSLNILQDKGICVSAGSACAKGHRSHVLSAMELPPEVIDGSFRVSLCRDTTEEELQLLVKTLRDEILPRAR